MSAAAQSLIRKSKATVPIGSAIIFAVVMLVYFPAMRAGFIWDDNSMLTENPFVKAQDGLRYLWFSTAPVDYFPLTYTSFWLEWRLWGMNATGYHITNILLHAISSLLLWRILKHLNIPGAWLAALVFGIHPVNVESVAWIAERKNTLCMFFYMLSLLFFFRSETKAPAGNDLESRLQTAPRNKRLKAELQTGPARGQRFFQARFQYFLSVFFFLLALLSKTAVVTLPVVLLLCAWWKRPGSAPSRSRVSAFPISRRDLLRTAPFFALSLVLGLVTVWFQHHRAIAEDVIREAGFWTRFGDAGIAIWFYLYKAVFPARLSFVYPEWEISAMFPWLAWLALIVCGAFFWWKCREWGRHLLFSFGYFVLMLLPVLGFLDIYFHRYSLVADHWQYFALPGIIVLVVSIAAHFFDSQTGLRRIAIQAAGFFVIGLLGVATLQQAKIYKTPEKLWNDTLSKNPNALLALNNFGLLLEREGKIDEAISLFEKSLSLKPDQVEGRNNLGSALLNLGKIEEALAQYRLAEKSNPKHALTRYNIANALDQQGKTNEAKAEYREALRLNPDYADAHNNLGCILVLDGKYDAGMAHFREALRSKPDNPDTLNNIGSILIESGKPQEALPLLTRALQVKPDFADAHYNLGNARLAMGQSSVAFEHFAAALEITPQMTLAHYKLGNLFFQSGRMNEAFARYSRVLELNPNLPEAHYQMAIILTRHKNMEPAIAHYKETIQLKPDWIEPLNNLAWVLATYPEEKFRDGKLAVEFAERACSLTENKNPGALDTLAAAQAESGDFSKAIDTCNRAAELARASGNETLVKQLHERLELYHAGKPFRE